MAFLAVTNSAKYFIEKGICKNKEITLKCVENRYSEFLMEGSEAWNEKFPAGYSSAKKTIYENSNLLHERFKGVIEIYPKL